MPNWVKNKLTIVDDNYEQIIDEITSTKDDEIYFDFNKIIPMPESVRNIISGTITDKCKQLFRSYIFDKDNYDDYKKVMFVREEKIIKLNQKEYDELMESCLSYTNCELTDTGVVKHKLFSTEQDVLDYGKRAYDNIINYGKQDWYDWSIAFWGTKWNAQDTEIDGNEITFLTAWDAVPALISTLSEKYPNSTFIYDFAEEQLSEFGGILHIKNGHLIEGGYFKPRSKEMYEHAFIFWPNCKRLFIYNEKKKTYVMRKHLDTEM